MPHQLFDSAFVYIDSACDNAERIKKIQTIIDALEDQILQSAGKSGIDEYSLDDGQIKIRTKYRNVEDIEKAISAFQKSQTRLINKTQGYAIQLRTRDC